MSIDTELVVTGFGCVTPLGVGVEALRRGWREGRCAIAPVRRFDTSSRAVRIGGEMPDPDGAWPKRHRGAAHLRAALGEALAGSGLPATARPLVLVATTKGFLESGRQVEARDAAHDVGLPSRWLVEELGERGHGFGAPHTPGGLPPGVMTISTACASGTAVLALAHMRREALRAGPFDAIVCVGIDLLSDFVFRGFAALGAMDTAPCRPFDVSRAGLSAGEAAAVVILETADAARRRGANVRGRLLGAGLSNDCTHPTAPDREGAGLARAISAAMADAKVAPGDLGHVHAHGTATVFNDAMELRALASALGSEARRIPLSTIKGNIGHTFGSAGLVETISSLLAVEDGVLPGVAGLVRADGELDVVSSPRSLRNSAFLKVGAGFGGFNAAVVASGVRR